MYICFMENLIYKDLVKKCFDFYGENLRIRKIGKFDLENKKRYTFIIIFPDQKEFSETGEDRQTVLRNVIYISNNFLDEKIKNKP